MDTNHEYQPIGTDSVHQPYTNWFWLCFILTEFFGLGLVTVLVVWLAGYHDGLLGEYPNSANYEPLFIAIGFVFLLGQALITKSGLSKSLSVSALIMFRVLRRCSSQYMILALAHFVLCIMVLVLAVLGYIAMFTVEQDWKLNEPHDWVQLAVVVLFLVELAIGFAAHLFPGCAPSLIHWYRPVHKFLGVMTFVLACVAIIMHVTMSNTSADGYISQLLAILFTFTVLAYGTLVVYILCERNFEYVRENDEQRGLRDEREHDYLLLSGGEQRKNSRSYASTDHSTPPETPGGSPPKESWFNRLLARKPKFTKDSRQPSLHRSDLGSSKEKQQPAARSGQPKEGDDAEDRPRFEVHAGEQPKRRSKRESKSPKKRKPKPEDEVSATITLDSSREPSERIVPDPVPFESHDHFNQEPMIQFRVRPPAPITPTQTPSEISETDSMKRYKKAKFGGLFSKKKSKSRENTPEKEEQPSTTGSFRGSRFSSGARNGKKKKPPVEEENTLFDWVANQ